MSLNYITWDINPEIVNIFGLSIRYYSLLFVGGLLLSIYVLSHIYKKENIPQEYLEKLSIYSMIGILAGARIGHCLFYEPSYYLSHPLEIILPIQSKPEGGYQFIGYQGLASHGGVIGLITALIIYSYKTKQSLIRTIDLIAIAAPLGGCFIRLANLMNSEIIGLPSTKPWAFIFVRVDTLPRHPAQLYEALSYLLIFVVLIILWKTRKKKFQNGLFSGLALILSFIARFLIEFLKEKQVAFEENMTFDMGQILSIPYILAGIALIISGLVKTKRLHDRQ